MQILGLDLGTNSIGWAIVDDATNEIIACGSRIFPEGVNRSALGKESSKNSTRREKRSARRQLGRRKNKKWGTAKLLMEKGMFPKARKGELQEVRLKEELRNFFALEPYALRAKAFEGKKLTPHELGRVFYQFSQRRGFLSNSKTGDTSETNSIKEGRRVSKSTSRVPQVGINETREGIGNKTLGYYLNSINPHEERIRNRYTERNMFIHEFNVIWEKQKPFYKETLTDQFKTQLTDYHKKEEDGKTTRSGLFYQMPLKSQKHLLGKCTFEPSKSKTPKSSVLAELYRMHAFINNLRVEALPLDSDRREVVRKVFLAQKKKFDFKKIVDALRKSGLEGKFQYKDKDKVEALSTIPHLRSVFGATNWNEFTIEKQESIWKVIYDSEDKDWLVDYAKDKWGLKDKELELLKKIKIRDGYSNLSKKAMKNIVPYLEKGLQEAEAVAMGGVRNVFGEKGWSELSDEKRNFIEDNVTAILDNDNRNTPQIKELLSSEFGVSEKQLGKLYHHSEKSKKELKEKLPMPENVRNPIVQQGLFELKRVVNTILEEFGQMDEIRVELTRDLKGSKQNREDAIKIRNEFTEKNDNAKKWLLDRNLNLTRGNIEKYRLWIECNRKSPYTGNEIKSGDLFGGDIQVEHIIPYSVSLNNSFGNKTLCEAGINIAKGNKTPYQHFGGGEKWDELRSWIYKVLPFRKAEKFMAKEHGELEDFISRQFNDTSYLSKEAKSYLENICKNVKITQGTVTSVLRHQWGLNSLLNPSIEIENLADGEYFLAVDHKNKIQAVEPVSLDEKKKSEEIKKLAKKGKVLQGRVRKEKFYPMAKHEKAKNRGDHRHHALDAIVIANAKTSHLQMLSALNAKGVNRESLKETQIAKPWRNFRNDVDFALRQMLISHKQSARTLTKNKKGWAARGQLHEETVYGKYTRTDSKGKQVDYYHVRKPIWSFDKKSQVEKIVDSTTKEIVEKVLVDAGLDLEKYKSIPKEVLYGFDKNSNYVTKVFMPNANGNRIPIKKIRIKEVSGTAQSLKSNVNQWVKPGNNHLMAVYQDEEGNYYPKIITFWEAVKSKTQDEPIIETTFTNESKLVFTVQQNDFFIFNLKNIDWEAQEEISDNLYRVQKISMSGKQINLAFRHHLASTLDYSSEEISIQSFGRWESLMPVKVRIGILGKIEPIE
ncbi:MAG: CRISPR-associated endonuclease Csn1 [Flammeovirgaceae bacterium]|jgi:CRISPR-associated endonuclease Csn1